METIFLIVLAAFNVWTIYFYNKLLLEVANGKEKEKKPPIDPMALVGKSLFKVSQLRKKEETEQKQTESMSVSDNDVTFDDSPKSTARISDEQLDDVFTNVRIEDIGVKYSDNKKDAVDALIPQVSSFEELLSKLQAASFILSTGRTLTRELRNPMLQYAALCFGSHAENKRHANISSSI